MMRTRRACVALTALIGLGACAGNAGAGKASTSQAGVVPGSGTVEVDYAGSLVSVMERHIVPAFDATTGFSAAGEARGSVAIANLIRGHIRRPDVFVSADPAVDESLQGAAGGGYVSWWVTFARTSMVIAWSDRSRFATQLEDARRGARSFESVLESPGMRFGRTDPELDPKGYRTLWLFQLDQRRTGDGGEASRILGDPENATQVLPEEQLVARLQSGDLDAAALYRVEAVAAGLRSLDLPAAIDQSDPAQAALYATVTYTDRAGHTARGSPIVYTLTIPSVARNQRGAESFVAFLLGDTAQRLLRDAGMIAARPAVSGDAGAVPASLRSLVVAS